MSQTYDASLRGLRDCGCCEGISVETPVGRQNRPGLSAVAYRAGTHARFKETLLARLSSSELPALADLRTRDDDDFSIALLDAWALVGDILTFYQERIANESYLRTATERRSILELARLIGYELRPGVAAGTYLAFNVEDATGGSQTAALMARIDDAPAIVAPPTSPTIPAGTKTQSVPGPDEDPQLFETSDDLQTSPAWNDLRPRLTRPRPPAAGDTSAYVEGISANLQRGEALVFVGQERLDSPTSNRWAFRRIVEVEIDADKDRTRVVWDQPLTSTTPADSRLFVLRQRASIFGYNAPDWSSLPDPTKLAYLGYEENDLVPGNLPDEWPFFNIFSPEYPPVNVKYKWGGFAVQQMSMSKVSQGIGANLLAEAVVAGQQGISKEKLAREIGYEAPRDFLKRTDDTIDLDQPFPQLVEGGWLVLALPDREALFRIAEIDEGSRASYMLSGKTARIRLEGDLQELASDYGNRVRFARAFVQSEELTLAEDPIREAVAGDEVLVAAAVTELEAGRKLIVTGRAARPVAVTGSAALLLAGTDGGGTRSIAAGDELFAVVEPEPVRDSFERWRWWLMDDTGFTGTLEADEGTIVYLNAESDDDEPLAEVATLESAVMHDDNHTRLELEKALINVYRRGTVRVLGNVVAATHGESVSEIVGSGDGAKAFASFTLKQSPVTHVSAASSSGSDSTLELRVNDLLWNEVDTLHGRGPRERVFATRRSDDGVTTVVGGDGVTGARFPSGLNNLRAHYRKGIGTGGNVAAGQISQLLGSVLGVTEVGNPVPASGAEDPETLEDARQNATLDILTLDRIVSLRDYEDFARAFAGIAKALATWTWSGEHSGVFVTVAGADGAELSSDSDLYANLLTAMREAGDPWVALTVATYVPHTFLLAGSLQVHDEYDGELVLAEVESALREAFSFEHRAFGQAVALSEVLAVIHGIDGVRAVDVDELHRDDGSGLESRLPAALPKPGTDAPEAAELLTLDDGPLGLEVVE